jgi:hypothetical protein
MRTRIGIVGTGRRDASRSMETLYQAVTKNHA